MDLVGAQGLHKCHDCQPVLIGSMDTSHVCV